MNNSIEVLLKLVRIAMGWEEDFSIPKTVKWREVLTLAKEQGVNAIVVDGLEILKSRTPELLSSPEDKFLLLEAIGSLQMEELNYIHHQNALIKLSERLSSKDIPFLLMKGFACGKNYPIPKHRSCGDIDIYPGYKFKESDEIFRSLGYDEERYYYRHSVFMIEDVMVENHRVLSDLRGPRRQTFSFETLLETEAMKSIETGEDIIIDDKTIPGAKYPNANFNALFLPWHVSAHFMFERVTLRHLLDWALFLTKEGGNINLEMFREAKRKYTFGFSKIADIITNLSLRYFKVPKEKIPDEIIVDAMEIDSDLADRVFNYMFTGQSRIIEKSVWKFRWNNIKLVWKNRWKYKEIYNMSVIGFLYQKAIGVIFKVGE